MRVLIAMALVALTASAVAGSVEDEADIKTMMADYRDAFVAMDAHRVAAVYAEPFTFLPPAPAKVVVLANHTEAEAALQKTMAGLKERGYARGDATTMRVKSFGNGVAIASAVWVRYKIDNSVLETIGATYLLRREPSGWKIAVVTGHAPDAALTLP